MSIQDLVYEVIQQRTGLTLNDIRRREIARYIDHFSESIKDYLNKLQCLPITDPLWQDLLQHATVGETYFFRNSAHFNALRHYILPKLIQERRNKGSLYLRVWSAGCATGEEPYSLAILLRQLLPDIDQWSVMLLATDINTKFLEIAGEGRYGYRSFRNETPDHLADRWFDRVGERQYQVKSALKQMVTFTPLNLATDVFPSLVNGTANVDLILCRNVTIYFNQAQTRELINRFYLSLAHNGWLIVGHAEPQPEVYNQFQVDYFERAVLYHKVTAAPVKATPPALKTVAAPIPTVPMPVTSPLPTLPVAPAKVIDYLDDAQDAANHEDWTQALTLLAQAEPNNLFNADLYYLRGVIYHQAGDDVQAITALRQAIYCDPRFALAHYVLGDIYAQHGQGTDASRHWRRALKAISDIHVDEYLKDDLTVGMLQDLISHRLKDS